MKPWWLKTTSNQVFPWCWDCCSSNYTQNWIAVFSPTNKQDTPYLPQHFLSTVLLIIDIALICIFLLARDYEHLWKYFLVHLFIFVCLFVLELFLDQELSFWMSNFFFVFFFLMSLFLWLCHRKTAQVVYIFWIFSSVILCSSFHICNRN